MTSPVRWCWRKAIGLKSPHVHDPETEIAPGVIRPSYALAGMVAGSVIANPTILKTKQVAPAEYGKTCRLKDFNRHFSGYVGGYGGRVSTWEGTVGGKPVVVAVYYREDSRGEDISHKLYVSFEDEKFDDWESVDKKLIIEALSKAARLKREAAVEKRRFERQQRANDIIQSIFTTPENIDEQYPS